MKRRFDPLNCTTRCCASVALRARRTPREGDGRGRVAPFTANARATPASLSFYHPETVNDTRSKSSAGLALRCRSGLPVCNLNNNEKLRRGLVDIGIDEAPARSKNPKPGRLMAEAVTKDVIVQAAYDGYLWPAKIVPDREEDNAPGS